LNSRTGQFARFFPFFASSCALRPGGQAAVPNGMPSPAIDWVFLPFSSLGVFAHAAASPQLYASTLALPLKTPWRPLGPGPKGGPPLVRLLKLIGAFFSDILRVPPLRHCEAAILPTCSEVLLFLLASYVLPRFWEMGTVPFLA